MNRLVCPRDKIDLGNLFFEGEERSSRTQVGHAYSVVNSEPRTSSGYSVRPSARLSLRCSSLFICFSILFYPMSQLSQL